MVDIKDLRITHFGNLANDAFPIVQALRDRKIDADLYVYRPAHVWSLPRQEMYNLDINDIGDPQLASAFRKYDLIIAHVPFSIYAQFSFMPYISFDAGVKICYFPFCYSSWNKTKGFARMEACCHGVRYIVKE